MYENYVKKRENGDPPKRGRPKKLHDVMTARFPEKTFEDIDRVKGDQNRADFVRAAVQREIVKRRMG